jgi:hypothetical protein
MQSALPKCHSALLKYRFFHCSEESPNPHHHHHHQQQQQQQQQSRL